jgi:hypothetical protein
VLRQCSSRVDERDGQEPEGKFDALNGRSPAQWGTGCLLLKFATPGSGPGIDASDYPAQKPKALKDV